MIKKPLPIVVCAVVFRQKILMIKRSKGDYAGLWALPGGKIEHGEHLSAAALREIKEEAGINSKFQNLLGLVSEHLMINGEVSNHFLINFCYLRPSSNNIVSSEEGEVKWFNLKKLSKHKNDIISSDYEMIDKMYLNKEGKYYNCVMKKENNSYILEKFELLS